MLFPCALVPGFVLAFIPKESAALAVASVLVLVLALTVSEVCVTVRRLHDQCRPGRHWLLLLIPFYNVYLALVLLFARGTEGPNSHGDAPVASHGAPFPSGRVR